MRVVKFSLASLIALAGCNPNPFCLNCQPGGDGGADASPGDLTLPPDLSGDMVPPVDLSGDGGCIPSNGGVEICDHIDNDCNGIVDDVDPAKLQSDPQNCGMCFNECSYVNAFGVCMKGVCSQGPCQPGYFNLNNDPKGCTYQCIIEPQPKVCQSANDCAKGVPCTLVKQTACKGAQDCPSGVPCSGGVCQGGYCAAACTDASGAGDKGGCPANTACRDLGVLVCIGELCDGKDNNCNGAVDEGFDFKTDPMNCGGCGLACNAPNVANTCTNGACTCGACTPGFKDLNMNCSDGCEYMCPVFPTKPETCNGIDDDCNGIIDDNLTDVGMPCDQWCPALAPCTQNNSCMFKLSMCADAKCCGICTPGKTYCAGGMLACQMGTGPMLEVCDGVDNNCDGQIDEGFNLNTDPNNCGKCGNVCNVPNAIAGCANGQCTVAQCKPGFADLDKNPANGCEYACPVNPPTVEVCNGKDDNCDGVIDNAVNSNVVGSLPPPPNFCNQTGICAGSKPVCCSANGWMCNYPSVNNHIEVNMVTQCEGGVQGSNINVVELLCDGFDGNCNGTTDESFPNKGKPCTVGIGACAGSGVYVCSNNMMTTVCPAAANPNAAVDELCNGIDDDCDGLTDERFPQGNPTCFNNGAHACKGWVDPMSRVFANNATYYIYQYEASHPDATNGTVGINANRSCANVGVLPWAPVTEPEAAAACAAVKDSMGQPMRLCTATEWQSACNLGNAANPVWSFQTNPATYNGTTCNGFDNGAGKALATGAKAACFANPANQVNGVTSTANLYDMSGNVSEWTSTQVMSNNKTYYQVKGGAYNNFANGINCDFSFTIELPTYQFNDLGFRCCSSNAP